MNLKTLPANVEPKTALKQIELDGAVIIKDLITEETVTLLRQEVSESIKHTPLGQDDFTGRKTQRTGGLASRSNTCRALIMNDLILQITNKYLEKFTKKILLHLTQTICINPGSPSQPLHRDRYAWGDYLPQEIEPQLNTIWALTDFTLENGATRCVPGSQKWEREQRARPSQISQAEMTVGSVFIYSGSVLHGGGENRSKQTRIGLNLTYCLGWLRQEENQYLSCPPDIARNFDPKLQDLLGYTQGEYALGYYSDPYQDTGGAIKRPERALD